MYRRSFLRAVGAGVGLSHAGTHDPPTTAGGESGTPTSVHTGGFAPLGSVALSGAKEAVVGPDGEMAHVAVTDGFATVDLADPRAPRVLAERRGLLADHEDGPLTGIQDVKVDGDRLLVVGPANPTGAWLAAALLYDVSDPANPVCEAVYPTEFAVHNCFLVGTTAYLTDNRGRPRLVVVDLDRGVELGSWSLSDVDPAWEHVSPRLAVVHDVYVRDGRAWVAHWDAGTWLLDVSDPAAPTAVAQVRGRSPVTLAGLSESEVGAEAWELPGNDHYVQPGAEGVVGVGVEAWDYDADGDGAPGGVELWDASAPSEATRLARIDPPATADATRSGVWTTAHNFDLVADRLYTSWYQGGVRVHDVSDPAAPRELAAWRFSERTSFWTAQLARPGECFVATSRHDPGGGTDSARFYTFPDPAPDDVPADRSATGGSGAGFGVAGGLAGLGVGAWLARRWES